MQMINFWKTAISAVLCAFSLVCVSVTTNIMFPVVSDTLSKLCSSFNSL